MKQVIKINGPVIHGEKTYATVTRKTHKVTSNVSWSIYTIDNGYVESDLFHDIAKQRDFCKGAFEIYGDGVKDRRKDFSRSSMSGGERWGFASRIPNDVSDKLVEYLVSNMTKIIEELKPKIPMRKMLMRYSGQSLVQ